MSLIPFSGLLGKFADSSLMVCPAGYRDIRRTDGVFGGERGTATLLQLLHPDCYIHILCVLGEWSYHQYRV